MWEVGACRSGCLALYAASSARGRITRAALVLLQYKNGMFEGPMQCANITHSHTLSAHTDVVAQRHMLHC